MRFLVKPIKHVKFNIMAKKTNEQHLIELISKGKDMSEAKELLYEIISDRDDLVDKIKKELRETQEDLDAAENGLKEMSEYKALNKVIDTNLGAHGHLKWKCDNISIQSLMETLGEELQVASPVELERRLKG